MRAKAFGNTGGDLWGKLWQTLNKDWVGRVSGKPLRNAESTLHLHMILYAAVGMHKRLLNLHHMQSKWPFSIKWLSRQMIILSAQKLVCLQFTWAAIAFRLCLCLVAYCVYPRQNCLATRALPFQNYKKTKSTVRHVDIPDENKCVQNCPLCTDYMACKLPIP